MSGTTCTPGPWILRNGQFICGAAGQIIAGVVPWNVTADEGARNAWLLAAAPDLYEALQVLLADHEEQCPCIKTVQAREALAKAEGR